MQTTEKEVVEEYNSQYQHIAKETIQATIDKKGNDIDLIVTGSTYTLTPQQKAEARQHYLKRAIPKLLKDNNISYEYEKGPRLNGSSYGVWPEHKVIMHTKDIDPSRNKQDALILYFPDCRPIHLDVSIDKYTERYEIEKKHPRPFAVLFQSLCEDLHFKKLIDDALAGTLVIPETLSLSEKMKAVVAQKKYISRSEVNKNIVEERQKREKEKTEIPF